MEILFLLLWSRCRVNLAGLGPLELVGVKYFAGTLCAHEGIKPEALQSEDDLGNRLAEKKSIIRTHVREG